MKTLKQHEEINLHIKKETFRRILRGIFTIPFACYIITSYLFVVWYLVVDEFKWWSFGLMISVLILLTMLIFLEYLIIMWTDCV